MSKSQPTVVTLKAMMTAVLFCIATMTVQAQETADAININSASAETLAENLDGIGPSLSQAIVEFRQSEGDFVTVEHLEEVSGIGMTTIENNRDLLSVE